MKHLRAFCLIGFVCCFSAMAIAQSESCIADLRSDLQRLKKDIHDEYLMRDLGPMYENYGLSPEREPELLVPVDSVRNSAVLLVHGFNASPFEVRALGEQLKDAGYLVYMPLIRGFGGHFQLANQYDSDDWSEGYKENFEMLLNCFDTIHVSGFSLGGGLTINFLLDHPEYHSKVKSVSLYAPYTKPAIFGSKLLAASTDVLFNGISFSFLYQKTRNPDLEVVLRNPQFYVEKMPVSASAQIARFGNFIRKKSKALAAALPFVPHVYYSEADSTIDLENMRETIGYAFPQAEYFSLGLRYEAPHQFLARDEANREHLSSTINRIVEDTLASEIPGL